MFIGSWVADWWTPFGCDKPAAAGYINYTLALLLFCIVIGYVIFTISGKWIKVDNYNKVFKLKRPWFEGLFTFLGLHLFVCYIFGLSIPCTEAKFYLIGAIALLFILEGAIGFVIYAFITRLKAPAKVKYTSIFAKR